MIYHKHSVDLNGIKPEIMWGGIVVASVYERLGYDCVVTSVNDGSHSRGSLHYVGMAMDFRIRHVPEEQHQQLRDLIDESLGPQYDVVLESTHIHVEYQPKV